MASSYSVNTVCKSQVAVQQQGQGLPDSTRLAIWLKNARYKTYSMTKKCQIQDLQYGSKMPDTRLAIWLKSARYKTCNMTKKCQIQDLYRPPSNACNMNKKCQIQDLCHPPKKACDMTKKCSSHYLPFAIWQLFSITIRLDFKNQRKWKWSNEVEKVKWAWSDAYLSQTMWNHTKNWMK